MNKFNFHRHILIEKNTLICGLCLHIHIIRNFQIFRDFFVVLGNLNSEQIDLE
jgi:hypothetical protein